jgi:2-polyprenyl-3-methyl-5-hydroxy-6-metoxy-1,4-benzoquinol methylase
VIAKKTPTDWFGSNYREIALADLECSMQNRDFLTSKANLDLSRMGSVRGLRVLEVGPGLGDLSRALVSEGAEVDACDIVDVYLKALAPDLSGKAFVADVESLGIESTYDIIILCDVLDHVLRPQDALLSVFRALKPQGTLYVRVPSFEPLLQYSRRLGCPWEAVHLRTYTPYLLKLELLAAGFRLRVKPTGKGAPFHHIAAHLQGSHFWQTWCHELCVAYNLPRSDPFYAEAPEAEEKFLPRILRSRLMNNHFGRHISLGTVFKPGEIWAVGQRE